MTKPKSSFKKRKGFHGKNRWISKNETAEENSLIVSQPPEISEGESDSRFTSPSPSSVSRQSISSSSSKIEPQLEGYEKYESTNMNDILNVERLSNELLKPFVSCKKFGGDVSMKVEQRFGLAAKIEISCSSCIEKMSTFNCDRVSNEVNSKETKLYDLNLRLVYGFRFIDKGMTAANNICAIMNLPTLTSTCPSYERVLSQAVKTICQTTMTKAINEDVEMNDGSRDLTVALDGSWQKRGHTSLNGIVTATSVLTGKAVDVSVLSKFYLTTYLILPNVPDFVIKFKALLVLRNK